MRNAVIFDLDGLMVDSSTIWEEAETAIIQKFGKTYSHEIRKKYLGRRVSGIIRILIDAYQLPLSQEEGVQLLQDEIKKSFQKPSVTLLPGCALLVRSLSQTDKYSLAVASSSPKEIIEIVVSRFGFSKDFTVLVSGEEVNQGKPAPDVFLKAAKLLEVKPKNCVVLEDAPLGIAAAKAGGLKAIAVNTMTHYQPDDFSNADLVVKSLEEINLDVIEMVSSFNYLKTT